MRRVLMAVSAMVLLAACGRGPGGPITISDYKLYEAVSDRSQIAVIDSRSHAIERWMELGTPSPDWNHLYSVVGKTLMDINPQTGGMARTVVLPGDYQLPRVTSSGMPGGLSQNGRWLVLETFDKPPIQLPSVSHFVLVNTAFNARPTQIDLRGYFEFDAVSNDGGRLFLLEYIYGNSNYRVRFYEVGSQQLSAQVVVDKSNPNESMTGERLSGIPSQDGSWLFSIYARQTQRPFIHALNLDQGYPVALCIDLPGSGYQSDYNALNWSLAMSADGTHLYAANGAMGMVSEIATGSSSSSFGQARSVKFDSGRTAAGLFAQDVLAKEFGANAAVISGDGKTLVTAATSGIVWIDTAGLRASSRALTEWKIWSLLLSPDGNVLYALSDSGAIAEISMTSRQVGATFEPHAGNPIGLIRVAPA